MFYNNKERAAFIGIGGSFAKYYLVIFYSYGDITVVSNKFAL